MVTTSSDRTSLKTSTFRPDIQALRAVAVALVVIFHVWPEILPGGFVGVDVFFVISGFLITAHLAAEVERSGSISISRFWARRIRRLLPAAFTVLAASVVMTFTLLPSTAWIQNLTEIGASALYAENWLLAANSVDYLASDNVATLVQHYWSLSVEEQFYFAWPILMVAALLAAKTAARRQLSTFAANRVMFFTLAAIASASFVYSVIYTAASPSPAYFSTFTRAWEFAAGGLLAVAPRFVARAFTTGHGTSVRALAGWLGLALVCFAAIKFDPATVFPGWKALAPVGGTIAVLWAGGITRSWGPAAIAGFRPLQFVGDISYSLYLWHWPLIVAFGFVFGSEIGPVEGMLIIAVAVALSWATTVIVENPARFKAPRGRRFSFTFAAAGMVVLIAATCGSIAFFNARQASEAARVSEGVRAAEIESCVGAGAGVKQDSCDDPFGVDASINPFFAQQDHPAIDCTGSVHSARIKTCEFGDRTASAGRVALVGDSHAGALLPAVDEAARDRGLAVSTFIKIGCSGLSTTVEPSRESAKEAKDCAGWSDNVLRELESNTEIDTVIFTYAANARPYYADTPSSVIAESVERVAASGKRVLFITDAPSKGKRKIPACLSEEPFALTCSFARSEATKRSTADEKALASIEGIRVLSLADIMCDESRCYPVVGDVVAYFDADHLSNTFSLSLAPIIGEQLEKLVASE